MKLPGTPRLTLTLYNTGVLNCSKPNFKGLSNWIENWIERIGQRFRNKLNKLRKWMSGSEIWNVSEATNFDFASVRHYFNYKVEWAELGWRNRGMETTRFNPVSATVSRNKPASTVSIFSDIILHNLNFIRNYTCMPTQQWVFRKFI